MGVSARCAAGLFGLCPVLRAESRPCGLIPHASSRLWRCALRLPPGESPAGYPRRASLAPLDIAEPACAGSAGPAPRCIGSTWRVRRGLLRQVVRMRAVRDALAVRCQGVAQDGHGRAIGLAWGGTPRCEPGRLRGTGRVPAGRWERPCRSQGASCRCLRAGMSSWPWLLSDGGDSAQGVLVLL